jgi:NAD(P)-dependent dehydrogenase (short-subunit alcohol dehydrogenase family)
MLKGYFDHTDKVAVVTGGAGVLCKAIARAYANEGVKVAILDINEERAIAAAEEINTEGGKAEGVMCNVLDAGSVETALELVMKTFGKVDILVNGAGGNKKEATTSDTMDFFSIPADAIRWVFDLNCLGTIIPSQVFGQQMSRQGDGCILNVSSMNAFTPLTKIAAYSAAKAAVSNFTQWLAVHMAQNYTPKIRVNAIAPGFFLTEQNRFLLTDEKTGELTPRGQTISDHTPAGRFGDPDDLLSTVIWLTGPGARFVTGIVVPVDGGFSAFSGV